MGLDTCSPKCIFYFFYLFFLLGPHWWSADFGQRRLRDKKSKKQRQSGFAVDAINRIKRLLNVLILLMCHNKEVSLASVCLPPGWALKTCFFVPSWRWSQWFWQGLKLVVNGGVEWKKQQTKKKNLSSWRQSALPQLKSAVSLVWRTPYQKHQ